MNHWLDHKNIPPILTSPEKKRVAKHHPCNTAMRRVALTLDETACIHHICLIDIDNKYPLLLRNQSFLQVKKIKFK